MKTLATSILVSLFVSLMAGPASAQKLSEADKAEAMKHFERGQAQIAEGSFDVAYRSFLSGYQLSGKPLFLFNMAECSRELGKKERAIRDYEMYLTQDPNGKLASTAKERLQELKGSASPTPTDKSAADKSAAEKTLTGDGQPEVGHKTERSAKPPEPSKTSAIDRSISPVQEEEEDDDGSFFTSAPFWIGVGVVVVAGSVTAIALASSGSDPSCEGSCSDLRGSF